MSLEYQHVFVFMYVYVFTSTFIYWIKLNVFLDDQFDSLSLKERKYRNESEHF